MKEDAGAAAKVGLWDLNACEPLLDARLGGEEALMASTRGAGTPLSGSGIRSGMLNGAWTCVGSVETGGIEVDLVTDVHGGIRSYRLDEG